MRLPDVVKVVVLEAPRDPDGENEVDGQHGDHEVEAGQEKGQAARRHELVQLHKVEDAPAPGERAGQGGGERGFGV